jgi:hypothetical protein
LSGLARRAALAPFRTRNYRFQWPADLLTSWAFEMEALVLGWYVMVETGSVLLLTVLASLNYVGTLIAPMFGVIGDRIGHRDLLAAMRACYDRDQGRAEADVVRPRGRGIGDGEVDLAILDGGDDVGDTLESDVLDRDPEPVGKFLSEVVRNAVGLFGRGVDDL